MTVARKQDLGLVSKEECSEIFQRVINAASDEGHISITLSTWRNNELKWARNRIWDANYRRDIMLGIIRSVRGYRAGIVLNQVDELSISNAVRFIETSVNMDPRTTEDGTQELYPEPPILKDNSLLTWDQSTAEQSVEASADIANRLIVRSEAEGMMSAGYIQTRVGSVAYLGVDSGFAAWDARRPDIAELRLMDSLPVVYTALTEAQCSVSVRHPKGRGSGWAGSSSYSWGKVDADMVANKALDKCLKSLDPVRIEPGRYVTILEPQAVSTLVDVLKSSFYRRIPEEQGRGPWTLGFDTGISMWRTKLGQQVVDERITLSHDPSDVELGVRAPRGTEDITWIENGVLQTLEAGRTDFMIPRTNQNRSANRRTAVRMSGGKKSMEEMISSTARGLIVTRFSNVSVLSGETLLLSAVTRDGLWLVEDGSITKAVQNMRITDSPLFAFNNVMDMGEAMPVFGVSTKERDIQLYPSIIPSMKINDFSFTSVNDAI